jgi:hypothetical protein
MFLLTLLPKWKLGLRMEFRSENIPRNLTWNGFRYSAEESAHSEAFRVPWKNQFRSSERNGMELNSAKYEVLSL